MPIPGMDPPTATACLAALGRLPGVDLAALRVGQDRYNILAQRDGRVTILESAAQCAAYLHAHSAS